MSSVASNWKGKMYLQSKWLRAIYKDILITSHFVLQDHQENKVAASRFPTYEASTQSKDKTQDPTGNELPHLFDLFQHASILGFQPGDILAFSWLSVVLGAIHFGFVEVIFELQSLWSPFCGVAPGRSFWKLIFNESKPQTDPSFDAVAFLSCVAAGKVFWCTTALLLPHGWENLQLELQAFFQQESGPKSTKQVAY